MGLTEWVGGETLLPWPSGPDHLPWERCWQDLGWGGGQCAACDQSGGQGGAHPQRVREERWVMGTAGQLSGTGRCPE